jgi:hypothetical protein
MKLCANYDVSGRIRSLTWFDAPDGVSLMLRPPPGQLVTEIEGHGLTAAAPDENALRDLAKNYILEAAFPRNTLRKKPRSA